MQESPYLSPAGLCGWIDFCFDLTLALIQDISHCNLSNNRAIITNTSLSLFLKSMVLKCKPSVILVISVGFFLLNCSINSLELEVKFGSLDVPGLPSSDM